MIPVAAMIPMENLYCSCMAYSCDDPYGEPLLQLYGLQLR